MAPAAFITSVAAQDGSYLTGLLLSKGYTVHGLIHRHDVQPVLTFRFNRYGISVTVKPK